MIARNFLPVPPMPVINDMYINLNCAEMRLTIVNITQSRSVYKLLLQNPQNCSKYVGKTNPKGKFYFHLQITLEFQTAA